MGLHWCYCGDAYCSRTVELLAVSAEHRRGVAGGGWEDEDDDQDATMNSQSANHSSSSNGANLENDPSRTYELLVFRSEFMSITCCKVLNSGQ